MTTLASYLNNRKTKKILSLKPGDEGFSLVELVIVIAVLAILSAVAIPAFQGVQARAKTAAIKNGLVNGVKECVVSSSLDLGETFDKSRAYQGDYTSYSIGRYNGANTCYSALATAASGSGLGNFWIEYNATTGVSTKSCNGNTTGCTAGKW